MKAYYYFATFSVYKGGNPSRTPKKIKAYVTARNKSEAYKKAQDVKDRMKTQEDDYVVCRAKDIVCKLKADALRDIKENKYKLYES